MATPFRKKIEIIFSNKRKIQLDLPSYCLSARSATVPALKPSGDTVDALFKYLKKCQVTQLHYTVLSTGPGGWPVNPAGQGLVVVGPTTSTTSPTSPRQLD